MNYESSLKIAMAWKENATGIQEVKKKEKKL